MSAQDSGPISFEAGLPQPGAIVGGYIVRRQIGEGGMAAVFEATHQTLGKRVALKMLLPHHAARSSVARRFVREGEAAAAINHPHAVDVTDVGTDARGAPYLVMEYLDGEDLASLLDRNVKLSVEQTADILVPVLSAIAAAHDLGIIHRDLKPSNIFLARRRQEFVPKVVDFGISKIEADSAKLTGAQALLGTPHYMSPEQAQGASLVDARTDQFAIGVIMYECVTGKRPFDGGTLWAVLAQILHASPTPPSKIVDALPPAFEALIERALRKNPDQRFPDLRTLGAGLLEFASFRTRLTHAADFGVDADALQRTSDARSQPAWRPSAYDRMAHAQANTVAIADDLEVSRASASRSLVSSEYDPVLTGRKWRLVAAVVAIVSVVAVAVVVVVVMGAKQPAVRQPPVSPVVASVQPAAIERPAIEQVVASQQVQQPVGAHYEVAVSVKPAHAALKLDGVSVGTGSIARSFAIDGSSHTLEASAPGYRAQSVRFRDRAPGASLILEKLVAAAAPPVVAAPVERVVAAEKPPEKGVEQLPEKVAEKRGDYGTNGAAIMR